MPTTQYVVVLLLLFLFLFFYVFFIFWTGVTLKCVIILANEVFVMFLNILYVDEQNEYVLVGEYKHFTFCCLWFALTQNI